MGRSPCCDKVGLKKGPWTPEEDQKLLAFIQEHGHGSWRALPPKAGLERCGKSCRLRWTNYLRPDIKRGKFSLQEEQTIIQLHALLGNRWSAIASHLPKRTDNEIKNYWNTHLKKRLVKMGIDPNTHKPKNHTLGNLSHMAQWESARLQAEARIVRQSNLLSNSNSYPSHFITNSSTIAPPRPPCLDILKVWQATWPKHQTTRPPFFTTQLQSPTSILNFSDNVPPIPTVGLTLPVPDHNSNYNNYVGKGSDDHQEEQVMEGLMEEYVPDHSPTFLEGFSDLPPSTIACTTPDNVNVFEDNKMNYWTNILNVVNSPILF